jgi:hypothetical protein
MFVDVCAVRSAHFRHARSQHSRQIRINPLLKPHALRWFIDKPPIPPLMVRHVRISCAQGHIFACWCSGAPLRSRLLFAVCRPPQPDARVRLVRMGVNR